MQYKIVKKESGNTKVIMKGNYLTIKMMWENLKKDFSIKKNWYVYENFALENSSIINIVEGTVFKKKKC